MCNLKPSVVNNFKAATPEGRTGFEALKPIVTCLDIKLEDECRMKPSCIWYTEDGGFCDGDFGQPLDDARARQLLHRSGEGGRDDHELAHARKLSRA